MPEQTPAGAPLFTGSASPAEPAVPVPGAGSTAPCPHGARAIKLAIVATHPIQYQLPWFRALAARPEISLQVYYAMLPDQQQQGVGFGVNFSWDIPLFEGYDWKVLENKARAPGLGHFWGTSTPGIYTTLRTDRPDALIITGWQSRCLLQALLACMRLRIPVIIRAESNALRVRRWWVRMIHRALLSRFDAYLCIGQANRDFYLGYGVPAEKIHPTHYFVDNQRIEAQAGEIAPRREALREEWGIAAHKTCFLFAGKLQEKKRIFDLLNALKAALANHADLHLLVAGSGEQLAQAQAMVQAEQLPVTFAGFLNQREITRAYVASDCLVLPSDYGETWGLVVNEAMVCGLPAIVSDRVGCGPDLVSEGRTGLIFPYADVKALAQCLCRMATEPAQRQAMGAQARAHVAGYSVENAVAGTLAAATSLFAAGPHTASTAAGAQA
jgi:glycosyltransferase involved in cell wall biosynthesis